VGKWQRRAGLGCVLVVGTGLASVAFLPTVAAAQSAGADLAVIAHPLSTAAVPGGAVTFTVTVTNNGPSAAADLDVLSNVAAPLVVHGASGGEGMSCAASDSQASCTMASLPAGTTSSFTVTADVPTSATNLTRLAIDTTASASTTDPDTSNNTASATFTVVGVLASDGAESTDGPAVTELPATGHQLSVLTMLGAAAVIIGGFACAISRRRSTTT
jgi:LPXTG-motif cell wall-anchored protein